ncbi:FolE GTP cyclohydrolase I [uncultured Caudovirales phage]|uniref:GTP cyclohydrolase I n=1 Tax=uncultured Caudovirales phage TaxID=2100421 RepID=A0A6J5MNU4_9CAUD|nr:FolE GTP cyclohydrolase I [uncultured Caudovirales phage]
MDLPQPKFANDHLDLTPEQIEAMLPAVESACQGLLSSLLIDTSNDHNSKGTAKRMAKMYLKEVFHGRYSAMPKITAFPNAKALDEIYTVGPISIRSACSHHFAPILGEVWIGIIPGDEVIGLSKFARLTDWIFSRPQIQEEATVQLADILEEKIKPKALAVIVKADHLCMKWRGVKEPCSNMITSVMRGKFRENASAKAEFMSLIEGQGFKS